MSLHEIDFATSNRSYFANAQNQSCKKITLHNREHLKPRCHALALSLGQLHEQLSALLRIKAITMLGKFRRSLRLDKDTFGKNVAPDHGSPYCHACGQHTPNSPNRRAFGSFSTRSGDRGSWAGLSTSDDSGYESVDGSHAPGFRRLPGGRRSARIFHESTDQAENILFEHLLKRHPSPGGTRTVPDDGRPRGGRRRRRTPAAFEVAESAFTGPIPQLDDAAAEKVAICATE